MPAGARPTHATGLRRLLARAGAHRLKALVVPGPEVLRAAGIDLAGANVDAAPGPRQANVLLLVGSIPEALREPVATAYRQMMRPRALVQLGDEASGWLPGWVAAPDLVEPFTEAGLDSAARRLRALFAQGPLAPVRGAVPGGPQQPDGEHSGAADASGHADQHHHGDHRNSNQEHAQQEHATHSHEGHSHEDHAHEGHAHTGPGGGGFMSMVAMTEGLPRGSDGLPMERLEVPFGPFFPGLPGGLTLHLTLAGDAVAAARVEALPAARRVAPGTPVGAFLEAMATGDPLAGSSYRLLACRAIEAALELSVDATTRRTRLVHSERARLASHLGWLAQLARQVGPAWLERRAARLQLAALEPTGTAVTDLAGPLTRLTRRLAGDALLAARLSGVGVLGSSRALRGPVARASGMPADARTGDPAYRELGFEARARQGGDAFARLRQRLDELTGSLELLRLAGADGLQDRSPDIAREPLVPEGAVTTASSGEGIATVETPRGTATLEVRLAGGRVESARLDPPSMGHLAEVPEMLAGLELGDALVAVGSLDLSPWESALPGARS